MSEIANAKWSEWEPVDPKTPVDKDGWLLDDGWTPVVGEEYVDISGDDWVKVDPLEEVSGNPIITEEFVYDVPLTETTMVRARIYPWSRNDEAPEIRYDVRVWYLRKRDLEWRPSQKGLSVPKDKLRDLLAAVQALVEEAESS
jgi:hypothetical protein